MRVFRDIRIPLLVLVLGLVFVWAINHYLFQERGYVVTAEFSDVAGLTPKSDVKIGGVNAGTVTKIAVTGHNTAIVTMVLPKNAAPIGRGATATLTPVNLLGEKYIALSPGDIHDPMPSGSQIPIGRTSESVELDQVLDMLDADTRTRLAILINEAGIAMDGRGTDFNALLAELPPSLSQARQLVAGLGSDNAELAALITQGDAVVSAMSSKRTDLQALVSSGAGALQAVADRRAQLGETIGDAPATLAEAQTALGQLRNAALALQPTAQTIQTTAPVLAATLAALPPFTRDAIPALRAVQQASPELASLSMGGIGPVERLRATALSAANFARELEPVTSNLNTGAFQNLLRFMWGWARTTQASDGLGHIFGLRFTYDKQFLQEDVERLLNILPGGAALRRHDHRIPRSSAAGTSATGAGSAAGTIAGVTQHLIGSVAGTVGGTVSGALSSGSTAGGSGSGSGSATGSAKLQGVLNYLLGP